MNNIFRINDHKKNQEENRRRKNIHSYRVQVTSPAAANIFFRQEPRSEQQVFKRMKEFTIEMSNIIEKVNDKASETLLWNDILLPANMAKTANDSGSAIQTILLLAFGCVAHTKFLLKISTKNTSSHLFSLLNNSIIFDAENNI